MFDGEPVQVLKGVMPQLIGGSKNLWSTADLLHNLRAAPRDLRTLRNLASALKRDGKPDLYVSDYEPCASLFAALSGSPLVTLDQQSKYRYFDCPPLTDTSLSVERQRLQLFAPRPRRALIASFVELGAPSQEHVRVIPPIVDSDVRELASTTEEFSVAYFSRYFDDEKPLRSAEQLAEAFRVGRPRTLHIYLPDHLAKRLQHQNHGNIRILPINRAEFLKDLARADSVFMNAGFNLIAESLLVGKPMFLVPLQTYDQHWCGHMIEKIGFGTTNDHIDPARVRAFLEATPDIEAQIAADYSEEWRADPVPELVTQLENLSGNRSALTNA